MTVQSSLYIGSVMHRRTRPRVHRFRYAAFWLLADLDELPGLSATLRLFSHNRPNLFSLRDTDHGDGSEMPLRRQAERQLRAAGIDIAGGPIRLLCMPRTLGYCFNPLSIYFCHRPDGALAALIYQVHNTFGERHSYLIPVDPGHLVIRQQCRKAFYVSPFMDMNLNYEFRLQAPGERIAVGIRVGDADGHMFNAALAGTREPLTDGALAQLAVTMPAITLKAMAAIHWEALRLWLKGLRIRPRASAPAVISVAPVRSTHLD